MVGNNGDGHGDGDWDGHGQGRGMTGNDEEWWGMMGNDGK